MDTACPNATDLCLERDAADGRPAFLITIDTEGDNLWERPNITTTNNATFLPRFQALCESHDLLPTYLVDYDMARSETFVEFGCDVLRRRTAEIGMHLHAWSTPPDSSLTADDHANHPYLVEYPESEIRDKVKLMTGLLSDTFGVPMRSHRAGRWAFDETYARVLLNEGYWVDCSVTPHISWRQHKGDPEGNGGSDYRQFPSQPYWVDLEDLSRSGHSDLLEVPMTIMPCPFAQANRLREKWKRESLVGRALNRFFPPYTWLRPKRDNLPRLLKVLSWAVNQKLPYVEFMLHSSELMPGGSPSFPTNDDIEKLYNDLDVLFEAARSTFCGRTLSQFRETFLATKEASANEQ